MSNIKIGNETEKSAIDIFRRYKYWAYNCPRSSDGSQPVDIIAIKKNVGYIVWLVDSKHVRAENASFPLSEIRPNQLMTMWYANTFANIDIKNLGFVIKFERTQEFYWLPYSKVLEMNEKDQKSINLKELKLFEKELEDNENN